MVKVPAAGGLAQADQNRQAGRIESRSSGGSTPWQAHRVVLLQLLLGEHAPSARRHAMQLVLVRLSDPTSDPTDPAFDAGQPHMPLAPACRKALATHVCLLLTTFLRSNSVSCPLTCSMAAASRPCRRQRVEQCAATAAGGERRPQAAPCSRSSCGGAGGHPARRPVCPIAPAAAEASKGRHLLAGNNRRAAAEAVGDGDKRSWAGV